LMVAFIFSRCDVVSPNGERSHAGPKAFECNPDDQPALPDASGSTIGVHQMSTPGSRDSREKAQEAQKLRPRQTSESAEWGPPGFLLRILRLFAANPFLPSAYSANAAAQRARGPWVENRRDAHPRASLKPPGSALYSGMTTSLYP
jgi:hypothetical protein